MLYEHCTWASPDIIYFTGAVAARGRLLYDDYPIHITAVNCTGVESRLYGCSLTFTSEDTQFCAVDQGVICQGQSVHVHVYIRLMQNEPHLPVKIHNYA